MNNPSPNPQKHYCTTCCNSLSYIVNTPGATICLACHKESSIRLIEQSEYDLLITLASTTLAIDSLISYCKQEKAKEPYPYPEDILEYALNYGVTLTAQKFRVEKEQVKGIVTTFRDEVEDSKNFLCECDRMAAEGKYAGIMCCFGCEQPGGQSRFRKI